MGSENMIDDVWGEFDAGSLRPSGGSRSSGARPPVAELEDGEHRYTERMVRKPGKPALKEAYLVRNADILAELEKRGGALDRVIDPETGQVEVHGRGDQDFDTARNEVVAPSEAIEAIRNADLVILGPGSLFTSVITNLLVPEIRQALIDRDRGKTFYVCNITTQPGQSDGFLASDHIAALFRHLKGTSDGDLIDHVLVQDPRVFHSGKGKESFCKLISFRLTFGTKRFGSRQKNRLT